MAGEVTQMGKAPSILTSKEEIMEYIGCSKHLLQQYISMGLPVLSLNGRWIAHTDNVDQFFRAITRRRLTDPLEQDPGTAQE
jgi:membrane protease subunit (stomatin/prohibitin family)